MISTNLAMRESTGQKKRYWTDINSFRDNRPEDAPLSRSGDPARDGRRQTDQSSGRGMRASYSRTHDFFMARPQSEKEEKVRDSQCLGSRKTSCPERVKMKHKHVAQMVRENPDGHSGSGATRKLIHGLRVGEKDTEWVRERNPSKIRRLSQTEFEKKMGWS